jgi:AraC-like DNA-binding protein
MRNADSHIKYILRRMRGLDEPLSYFSGRQPETGSPPLPGRVLVFKREGVSPGSAKALSLPRDKRALAGAFHHRWLLSVNLGAPCQTIVDGARFVTGRGGAALIYPHQHHLFIHDRPDIRRLMVSFEAEPNFFCAPPRDRVFRLGAAQLGTLAELLDRWLAGDGSLPCSLLLALLLSDMRAQTEPEPLPEPPGGPGMKFMDRVVTHIHANTGKRLALADLGARFGISPSHLRLKFRRALGVSIGRFISDARVMRARRYLEETDLRVEEIAARCGYESIHAFSRAFKNRCGVTPSQFRRGGD